MAKIKHVIILTVALILLSEIIYIFFCAFLKTNVYADSANTIMSLIFWFCIGLFVSNSHITRSNALIIILSTTILIHIYTFLIRGYLHHPDAPPVIGTLFILFIISIAFWTGVSILCFKIGRKMRRYRLRQR